ncbi:MAG TPA: MBL fold metallo-hydrolase, partial [Spirochaetota bacterium]|nr:MBL fold metallo-hydrolase [Spirochaetota bacterium]
MKIRFWGVRGSIPTPPADDVIREKLRRALLRASPADISSEESIDRFIDSLPYSIRGTYGGNTTCLEVRTADDDLFIIDCGTGIRHLSTELMKGEFGRGQGVASIL